MKTIITIAASIIFGVILTVFCFQAYTIYVYRSVLADDHATLSQVVSFINQQVQASNKGASPTK